MNQYLGQRQDLDWASPSRLFATTVDLFNSQPNYEHEVAIALDTRIKYQGVAPVVGGWGYATGAPGPYPPLPDELPVNDGFTKLLLEFEGIEGSTTYEDTNAAGWPRKWSTIRRAGFGSITNQGELFGEGALRLDGATVLTAPDDVRFVFDGNDFTVRGYFLCDFPLGEQRILSAKTDLQSSLGFMYWVDRTSTGNISVALGIDQIFAHRLLDRFDNIIVDRFGEVVVADFDFVAGGVNFLLQSTTIFSDTINVGWHSFEYSRLGSILHLKIDGVEEDTKTINGERALAVPGPITIGGYGPPKMGMFSGKPWIGGLDRFAIDIGVAR
jgi:hypothetical protein